MSPASSHSIYLERLCNMVPARQAIHIAPNARLRSVIARRMDTSDISSVLEDPTLYCPLREVLERELRRRERTVGT